MVKVTIVFQSSKFDWEQEAAQANVGKLLEEVPFCYFPGCFAVKHNGTALDTWDHFGDGDIIEVSRLH